MPNMPDANEKPLSPVDALTLSLKNATVLSVLYLVAGTVVEVLPNGHMVVTGEKQIGVNQNVDVLRFSGTIDPKAVQPGNVVSSNKVANARMESRGRGAQAEAQTVGLLTRFFFSFLPF